MDTKILLTLIKVILKCAQSGVKNNMNTKETIIKEVKETWSGLDRNGTASALYQVIDGEGDRYSTKNGAYYSAYLGKKLKLQWNTSPSKKLNPKTGEPYINKNLVEGSTAFGKGNEQLDRIEKNIKEIRNFLLPPL